MDQPLDLELRTISADELGDYLRVIGVGFGSATVEEYEIDQERELLPLDRTIAAVVDGAFAGGAADYPFEMTVPGGATVAVAGVTGASVQPTHRRRGILRALMRHQLDAVAARGEPMAILNASESGIYGRFGYGLAQQYQTLVIDCRAMRFAVEPPPRRMRLVRQEDAHDVVPAYYEPYRRVQPGSLTRSDGWWRAILGEKKVWKGGGKLFVVVAESDGDDPGGYAIYEIERNAVGRFHVVVRELAAVDPGTEAALWRFCAQIDLADDVEAIARPLDEPLRWRLAEPRQLRTTRQSDYLWVRILDVERCLEARAYPGPGTLVIEVDDPFRPETSGRYELEAAEGRARCRRTERAPDLQLGIDVLGSLYLGGVAASVLARAGRVTELVPGSVHVADRLFAWPVQPHCTTMF